MHRIELSRRHILADYAEHEFTLPDDWQVGRSEQNGYAVDEVQTKVREDAIAVEEMDGGYAVSVSVPDVGILSQVRRLSDGVSLDEVVREGVEYRLLLPRLFRAQTIGRMILGLTAERPLPVITARAIIADGIIWPQPTTLDACQPHVMVPEEFESFLETDKLKGHLFTMAARELKQRRSVAAGGTDDVRMPRAAFSVVSEFARLANKLFLYECLNNSVPVAHVEPGGYQPYTQPLERLRGYITMQNLAAHLGNNELPYPRQVLNETMQIIARQSPPPPPVRSNKAKRT